MHFPGFFCQLSRKNGINIGTKYTVLFSFFIVANDNNRLAKCFFFYKIQIPNHSGEYFARAFGINLKKRYFVHSLIKLK